MAENYDFSGYVTRNDITCSDGRVIRQNAFADQDGETLPLIYNHNHDDMRQVVGHITLQNRSDGVYGYGKFNDTESGQLAHSLVRNGDIRSLSIYANKLQPKHSPNVEHGVIREVSLVLAGANPGAFIDNPVIAHSDGTYTELEDDAEIYFGEDGNELEVVEHADKEEPEEKEDKKVADTEKKERTVGDVYNEMTDEQKKVVEYLVAQAADGGQGKESDADDSDEDEEEENVKHNAFNGPEDDEKDYITHADQEMILDDAKRNHGKFQDSLRNYVEENTSLSHADAADAVAGFDDTNKVFDNRTSLNLMFPDFREANGTMPELITNDQGWITVVLNKVKKAPYSRVRTSQVDIRNLDDLRAKGYMKGKKKALTGSYSLIRRTTDPQTVYVRSSLNRDDITDITDFDYVQYQYNIDKLQLNEEVATAIMIGDGRTDDSPDKIFPEHIRPIWTDDELYVKHVTVDFDKAKKELQGTDTGVHFGDSYVYSEAIIEALLHARETNWKGNGTPDFYCTPALMNTMLLARDFNGRRIYDNRNDLTAALNIGQMVTAEQFTDKIRTDANGKKHKLLGIVGNLNDYQVGSTKGGEISHFTQFDIDFNQEKSLIETRLSGAVTRIYSFIVLEEDVADSASASAEG